MLLNVGGVSFEVVAPNIHAFEGTSDADFVEKAVAGGAKPLEFVGIGTRELKVSGKLFPKKTGGLSSLSTLSALQASGLPQVVMRGDGTPLGWFAITRLSEKHSYLSADGVGQVVEFDIDLKRDPEGPDMAGFFSRMGGFF
jgi:phage protein U